MKRLSYLVLSFALAAATIACGRGHSAAGMTLNLAHDDKPKANKGTVAAFQTAPLYLAEIVDARVTKDHIGVAEDNNSRATTNDPVALVFRRALAIQLEAAGVTQVEQPKDLTLAGELREFFVRESGGFEATVQVQFTLSRGSETLFTKLVMGKGSVHGRSHNPENYNEALAEATHNVTSSLLTDVGFEEAVTGKPVERPAPPVVDTTPDPKMKLAWKPPAAPFAVNAAVLSSLQKAKIIMPPFTNARLKQNEIAIMKDNRKVMHTPDKVEAFVDTVVRNELVSRGVRLEDAKTSMTLAGQVVEFFVTEDDKFIGVVRLRFTLSKGDTELWTEVVEGTSKVHGRDHDRASYNEALSTALTNAMAALLNNKEFGAALKK